MEDWSKQKSEVVVIHTKELIKKIEVKLGDLESLLERNKSEYKFPFMSKQRINFLSTLSRLIFDDPASKEFADVISFAFWCRQSNLIRISSVYSINVDEVRMGTGLTLHIAPANVPINFAFSFAFSFLSGNSNIVRVPSKEFKQVDYLLSKISECMSIDGFEEVKTRNVFIRYEKNSQITEFLSQYCDRRMIWGGDKTVSEIKEIKTKPNCIDIPFVNKFSLAIIDAQSVYNASDDDLNKLVRSFFNDSMLFDQNACSSPKEVIWLGCTETIELAKTKFWSSFALFLKSNYELTPYLAMNKFTNLCIAIAESNLELAQVDMDSNLLYKISGVEKDTAFGLEYLVSGAFVEFTVDSISELFGYCRENTQTLTYFGIERSELIQAISKMETINIDRIVPIGNALDIDIQWDGMNLPYLLSHSLPIK